MPRPILIVDDDPRLRKLVATSLRNAGYAVAEAARAEDAYRLASRQRPALVVLDVNLPDTSGYEVCRRLKRDLGESLPVLFLSGERTEPFDRVAGLMIGADDYVAKPFAPGELVARVEGLLRRANGARRGGPRLTKRELEVLRLLAEGKDQAEIASALVISPKTVGTHIEHILSKLGVRSRAQAVAAAYRDRLLER